MSAQHRAGDTRIPPFEVHSEAHDGVQVIAVHGELDLSTAPELAASLQEAVTSPQPAVAIDFHDCGFIDSTGIALLVSARRQLSGDSRERRPGRLALCGVNRQLRRVFDVAGLEPWLAVYPSLAEAVPALRDSVASIRS